MDWDRMPLTLAVLFSCLSLSSSAAIYAFDPEANRFCYDDCFPGESDYAATPCNSSVAGQKTRRVCDMKGGPEEFRINANNAKSWDVLSVSNASTVKLENTKLAQKIYLKSVPSIIIDSSVIRGEGFSFLNLEDCHIGEEYPLSFNSLKTLRIVRSVIGVIMQTSINEIDIRNGSRIKKLSAVIEKLPERTEESIGSFKDSTVDEIEMLHIKGNAKIVMTSMTINDIQNMEYSSNQSSSVSSSYIEKITSLVSKPSSEELEFDEVEIGEIISNGLIIMGKFKITNSVIHKSSINGIVIRGSGEITFRNTTVNGVQLSYTLKADPSSNATVTVLHLSVVTFPSSIVYWVIVAVLAAVIVGLLYFVIKPKITKRNSNAADDPNSKNLESNDLRKVSANYYTKNTESQDIPMRTRNEPDSTGQATMLPSLDPSSQEMLKPSHLPEPQDLFDAFPLPLPPPHVLSNIANIPQPLYDEVEGGESDANNSVVNSLKKTAAVHKNFLPSPNPQTSGQASNALHPEVSSHAAKPMLPHQSPYPVAPYTALPVSSHYATRGQVKPPPPSRNPPTHRKFSQPTGGHGLPSVELHPAPATDMSDYQDTIQEEPLYASEDELRNY